MFNIKKLTRPISLILLPTLLLNSMPLALLAQDQGQSSSEEKKILTSAIVIANYRSSYDNFINEIQLTTKELSRTNKKLGNEIESSEDVKYRLKILKTLNGKTPFVKSKIKTIGDTAHILSVVPQVRTPMKIVYKGADKAQKQLKTFEKKIKPLHKKATTFKQRVLLKGLTLRYNLIKKIKLAQKIFNQKLLDKAKQADNYITASIYCANLNMDSELTKLAANQNKLSEKMKTFRETLKKINDTTIKTSGLLKDINISLLALKPIKIQINALSKILKKISVGLNGIGKFFKKSLKYKFKRKFWGKTIRFKIKIKLSDIFKGPSRIFGRIERYLGKFLFKVAKAIGVKKIIKKFIREAKRKIKKLLKKYNLDFSPKLGKLKGINGIKIKLESLFKKLKGIYTLPNLDFSLRTNFRNYLKDLPRFKMLSFACKNMKKADVGIIAVKIKGEAAQANPTSVNVKIKDYQDMNALNTLKKSKGFKAEAYNRKCVLTLESNNGYRTQTKEFILKAGETKTVKAPWIPLKRGETELMATVSIKTLDINLDNNSKELKLKVLPPSVDLLIKDIAFDEKGLENTPVIIRVITANLSADYSARAMLKLSAGDEIIKSDEIIIDPASEEIIELQWTPKAIGKSDIKAEIVSLNTRDIEKDNNSLMKSFEIGKMPIDLSIEDFFVEEETYSGDTAKLKLKIIVKNEGPKATDETAKLLLTGDDGYKREQQITLEPGEEKEFTYDWSASTFGAVQFDAEIKSETEDLYEEDNFSSKTFEIKSPKTQTAMGKLDALLETLGIKDLTKEDFKELTDFLEDEISDPEALIETAKDIPESLTLSGDMGEVKEQIIGLLERLKTNYERGNKPELPKLFSKQFPNFIKFIRGIQDDTSFFRNISLTYRINNLTLAPDKKTAVASVHWEIQFMTKSGKFYKKTTDMNMKFVKEKEQWIIGAMTNNNIFGASQLSLADLKLLFTGLNVTQVPINGKITGIVVKNIGNAKTGNFRVKYTYTHSSTPQTGYVSVSSLMPNGSTNLIFTISTLVPGPSDSLKIEIDPDKNIPEIKLGNNIQTKWFPF